MDILLAAQRLPALAETSFGSDSTASVQRDGSGLAVQTAAPPTCQHRWNQEQLVRSRSRVSQSGNDRRRQALG